MKHFCPTIVIRHRKERLKKCSLRGLEERKDFLFFTYPLKILPPLEEYVLLSSAAPQILSKNECDKGLLLLDATWKLAEKMEAGLQIPERTIRRSLPPEIETAYPRRQDERHGLASIEALYIAYLLTGRHTEGLLDNYYWKEHFLEKNKNFSILIP
jgi:pre-rRNA-processing protein TSR3